MATDKSTESNRPNEAWALLATKAQETAATLLSAVSELSVGVSGELEDFSRLTLMASTMLAAQNPDDQTTFEAATFEVMALMRGAIAAGGDAVSLEHKLIVQVAGDALSKLMYLATPPGGQPLPRDVADAQAALYAATATEKSMRCAQEPPALHPAQPQAAAPSPASSASDYELDDEPPENAVFHEVVFHRTDLETHDVPARSLYRLTGRTRDIAQGCCQVLRLIEWDEYHSNTAIDGARPAVLSINERSMLTRLVSSSLELLKEACDHEDETEESRQKTLDKYERQRAARRAEGAVAA